MSYLGNLTFRLAAGAMRLPEGVRRRHTGFLLQAQQDDGGFAGRAGPSDLYYTGFGLRGLVLLGGLTDAVARRAAGFLQARLDRPRMPSIDALSLVYSSVLLELTCGIDVYGAAGRDRLGSLNETLNPLRRDDGGYAKTERSGHSSTYHTFLAASCLELLGAAQQPGPMTELIRSRRRDDGGFVELDPLRHSGTNPTAAAVGLLRLFDAMEEPARHDAVRFLAGVQNAEGGFRANTRIPVADLLSTFTGLVALADLDGLASVDTAAARRYAHALEQPGGGFRGGSWDNAADVEYTFYGVGVLALLAGSEG